MAGEFLPYLGNILVLNLHKAYRREVVHYLDLMRTTESGRILCKFINQQPGWMAIIPYKPTAEDPVNAYAQQDSWADAAPKDTVVWGTFTIAADLKIPMPLGLGTGKGSNVYVRYHPATWTEHNKRAGRILPGAGPGEILFHEMLHGYRMLTGNLRQDKVPGYPEFDDIEEFYAILAANVYRTQRGFRAHRFNHHGFAKLDPSMDSSLAFYTMFQDVIDAWFTQQQPYCMAMARTVAKFNPFRAAAVTLKLMPGPITSMAL